MSKRRAKNKPLAISYNDNVISQWKDMVGDKYEPIEAWKIRDYLERKSKPLYPLDIVLATCNYYGVSPYGVMNKGNRNKDVCLARSVAAYILSVNTTFCLNKKEMAEVMKRKSSSFIKRSVDNIIAALPRDYDGELVLAIKTINSRLISLD